MPALFRVENPEGIGPWRGHSVAADPHNRMSSWCESIGLHPLHHNQFDTPLEAGLHWAQPNTYLSAFENLAQIEAWFPFPLRQIMANKGYRVMLYQVPRERLFTLPDQLVIKGMSRDDIQFLDSFSLDFTSTSETGNPDQ